MEKLLVVGGTGLLGMKLVEKASKDYEVQATYLSHKLSMPCEMFPLDIQNSKSVMSLVKRIKPDVVINTAALHRVDYCEDNRKECWNVNVKGTENIANSCKAAGSRLVFVSTDYLFDGKKEEYTEQDKPNPLNYYGYCKLKAEEILESMGIDHVIARTAVIYGWNPTKLNFVTWAIGELESGNEIKVVNDQHSNPTLADDLAEMMLALVKKGKTGVFNTTGSECLNRYDFAKKIAKAFGLDLKLIKPIKTKDLYQKAARPERCKMSVEKITTCIGRKPLDVTQGLERMRGGRK